MIVSRNGRVKLRHVQLAYACVSACMQPYRASAHLLKRAKAKEANRTQVRYASLTLAKKRCETDLGTVRLSSVSTT